MVFKKHMLNLMLFQLFYKLMVIVFNSRKSRTVIADMNCKPVFLKNLECLIIPPPTPSCRIYSHK